LIYEWILTASESGEAVKVSEYADKSYGMWGTFGGTVTIQGSWDPCPSKDNIDAGSWMTLRESDNITEIANTAAACGVILENPLWIRVVAGSGITSVKTVIVATPRR